jgi:cephalosporin hydroxylase
MSDLREQTLVDEFHRLYYGAAERTWLDTYWRGVRVYKYPSDLWVYQEILWETRPDLIVECGTAEGGSAFFLASLCEILGRGEVVTIDIDARRDRPVHERITYLTGSSLSPEILATVRAVAARKSTVMVLLDSDHRKDHVLAELREYSPLVTLGSYLVVEDTNVNGNPVRPDFGPGPGEAVREFQSATSAFEIDRSREKFLVTANPGGFLRRVRGAK